MTPEQIARKVVLAWWHGPYNIHSFDQTIVDIEIADVARAIKEAIAEEREACAGTIAAMGREFSEAARGHSNELRYAFDHFFVAIGLRVLHREEEWPSAKESLQAALEKARGQPTASP